MRYQLRKSMYSKNVFNARTSMKQSNVEVTKRLQFARTHTHQCVLPRDLQRVGTAFTCQFKRTETKGFYWSHSTSWVELSWDESFCNTSHSRVSLLCSAFLRGYEHAVKWLYYKRSADRPTVSLSHSQRGSMSYTSSPTVTIGRLDNGYEISRPIDLPKTTILLFKRFTNRWEPFNNLSWCPITQMVRFIPVTPLSTR